jgi:hypothetical protein
MVFNAVLYFALNHIHVCLEIELYILMINVYTAGKSVVVPF